MLHLGNLIPLLSLNLARDGSGLSLSPKFGLIIRTKARLFHLYSKARARLKPDLFSNFFKPEKARALSMKPKPNPSSKKSGPTYP
jgi:hypothetical protein